MSEPLGKAAGFNTAVKVIREMCTPEEFAKLVASVSAEVREQIEHPPMPVTWLPNRFFHELIKVAHLNIFAGNDERIAEVGRRAVMNDLKTLYKMFIRFMSPGFVIDRAAGLWHTYTRLNGDVTATRSSETSADILYQGVVSCSPTFWAYQRGAIRGVVEATGLKQVSVETLSGGRHDSTCTLRVSWGEQPA
jgi:hypothetical protein